MLTKPPAQSVSPAVPSGSPPDPRQEIVEYFRRHPAAADTLDGIVEWWLPRQRYETARAAIQEALDDLVRRGVVDRVVSGNTRLYRLAKKPLVP